MEKCWINVYKALYPTKRIPYYISLGYGRKKDAIDALGGPKAKGIRDRYVKTIQIKW